MNCAAVVLLLLAADVGELKWDLSRSQRIEQVAWPGASGMNEEYEKEKKVSGTLFPF